MFKYSIKDIEEKYINNSGYMKIDIFDHISDKYSFYYEDNNSSYTHICYDNLCLLELFFYNDKLSCTKRLIIIPEKSIKITVEEKLSFDFDNDVFVTDLYLDIVKNKRYFFDQERFEQIHILPIKKQLDILNKTTIYHHTLKEY